MSVPFLNDGHNTEASTYLTGNQASVKFVSQKSVVI